MRHYMVDPDNEERLLKVPPSVVYDIKAEAYRAAQQAVRDECSFLPTHLCSECEGAVAAIDVLSRKEPND